MSKARLLALGIAASAVAAWANFPVTVTMFVKDEEGNPVEGAQVKGSIERSFSETGEVSFKDLTDAHGMWQRRESTSGDIGGTIWKEGWYATVFEFKHLKLSTKEITPTTHFLPVTNHIVLRKKINPVPMYAREVTLKVPVSGKPMGFDFMAGDWVVPDGKGKVADVVMTLSWSRESSTNWAESVSIAFPNPGDGIIKIPTNQYFRNCSFELPRFAPENGYETTLAQSTERKDNVLFKDPSVSIRDECFFFRIRSETTPDGRVKKALYGKIRSQYRQNGISAYRDGDTGTINFTYYLNPDGTRNMEFDYKRNLYKDFKPGDIRQPQRP